ncbi:hypothetical protein CEXT_113431 [Caerostris extrusa]|uniref:C2H2-type domain-containing protein n=1 Tax=Caerostris extrusa TaxID=172846 RepID=A0AAV4MC60_CAEEX|nr:hypothetical protein CEXT_113431 [Caerostris extrusa]
MIAQSAKRHQCSACGYSILFSSESTYEKPIWDSALSNVQSVAKLSPERLPNVEITLAKIAESAKRHQCCICGYSTFISAYMEKHIRIHTGERAFQCTLCTKSFKQQSSLKAHMGQHPLNIRSVAKLSPEKTL